MSNEPCGTLHYFDGHGRAEHIRLALRYCNVNFVDHRFQVGSQEWTDAKPNMPPGGLPCWEEPNGFKCNETPAVARYLSKKFGFYPTEPKKCWDVDATYDFLYEQWAFMAMPSVAMQKDEETLKKYTAACQAVVDKVV